MSSACASLGPEYFERVYAGNDDPWQFETSPYEHAKYERTMAALPAERTFARGFEIGCSIGVLTAQLAARCATLLAIDVNDGALQRARARNAHAANVTFERMAFPAQTPAGRFDLVIVSEVGYYWSPHDLTLAADRISKLLDEVGTLVLVHWTHPVRDYPLTGDAVHAHFLERAARGDFAHRQAERTADYRLDAFTSPGWPRPS